METGSINAPEIKVRSLVRSEDNVFVVLKMKRTMYMLLIILALSIVPI